MDGRGPGWLFLITLGTAMGLGLVVLLAPLLDADEGPRLVALFARDWALRRTALAAAAGLVVTAFVFFAPRPGRPSAVSPRGPRRPGALGA
jgi:hypothetical protein